MGENITRTGVWSSIAGLLLTMCGCTENSGPDVAANNSAAASAAERPIDRTEDGRFFVPAAAMWKKYRDGAVFCYEPNAKENSCRTIEYAESVTADKAVLVSIIKWNDVEKQVFRVKTALKDEYACSTTDDWSVDHSTTYITSDPVAKVQSTDISTSPESIARWREDLKQRWAGIMGQEFCFRYALRSDAKGKTHAGEFEEFKYSEGVRQPQEKPVLVNTYDRADLSKLVLRPQN